MDLLQTNPTIGSVTRRIPRSPAVVDLVLAPGWLPVGAVVPLGGRASLRIDAPFEPVRLELASWGWHARLRLRWPRPTLAPEPLVGVELSAWSTTVTELRLFALAPHSFRWGERRWDRYFTLAHAAADTLVARIASTPTGLPAGPPMALTGTWSPAQN